MGKRKSKKATYYSINEKFANSKLKNIDKYMDELRMHIGKKGDGANGGSTTLIGAVEGLNNEAQDGKALTDAYNYFNSTTLTTFKKQITKLDSEFNVIDKIAK